MTIIIQNRLYAIKQTISKKLTYRIIKAIFKEIAQC